LRVIVAAVLISGMPDDLQLVGDNDRSSPAKMNNQPTSTAAAAATAASRLHRCGLVEMGVRADGAPYREETKDLLGLSLRERERERERKRVESSSFGWFVC